MLFSCIHFVTVLIKQCIIIFELYGYICYIINWYISTRSIYYNLVIEEKNPMLLLEERDV